MSDAPFVPLDCAEPQVDITRFADGTLVLRSPLELAPPARQLGVDLRHWSEAAPDRDFLVERGADGAWHRLTFAEVRARADRISQALIARGLSAERPVAILSDNGTAHALLALAAMQVGIPVAPVSPAYSLMSKDFAKLRHIIDLLEPGLVFVDDGPRFAAALAAVGAKAGGFEIVAAGTAPPGLPATGFATLQADAPTDEVERRFATTGPETVAKILFTSGSTGMPKGVINTQRMLCSSQQAYAQINRFFRARPPVTLDWLPWNHTFGGNNNFNMLLHNGGTLYIDNGKPVPGLFERTLANLRDVSPTVYWNVPRGFDMLATVMEQDAALRECFFRDLDFIQYAGAALPDPLWKRLEALSVAARGARVMMVSAWGLTETAPMHTAVHWPIDRAGVVGLPVPGATVKLIPIDDRYEMRAKGENVTPGYYKRDDLSAAAFDEDGYFKTGDAGRFLDPDDPLKGLVFDGRLAEAFKLMSGTWVHVGELRLRAVAAIGAIATDALVTGHGRDEVGLLVFANLAACRRLCPELGADATAETVLASAAVREALARGLRGYNHDHRASSMRVGRALLMADPPQIDANEITDKGYVNQRAGLQRRAALVERLYATPPPADVLILTDG